MFDIAIGEAEDTVSESKRNPSKRRAGGLEGGKNRAKRLTPEQRRLGMRRLTRLTNAFSKKIQDHAAMVAIYAVHDNFARIHKTLRITPAMACGLSDHVWNLEEIGMMADSYTPASKPRGSYKKRIV